MDLNLYNIFEEIILESVANNQIIDSIKQPFRIKFLYQGEDEQVPQWRFIDPYVLGTSKAGNLIVRGFQTFGFTTTEIPKWKTYRVDRILQWEPTQFRFGNKPINAYDSSIPAYNMDGSDRSMIGKILAYRTFNNQLAPALNNNNTNNNNTNNTTNGTTNATKVSGTAPKRTGANGTNTGV
jgi:hypothetical protein